VDVEEIRKLIRLMEEAGLTELEIEDRSGKVRLVRGVPRKPHREPEEDGEGRAGEPARRESPDLDFGTATAAADRWPARSLPATPS
jgi:hypothetical protein